MATSLVAFVALVVGIASAAASLVGAADAGVSLSADGQRVDVASPVGFAWQRGIRAGQTVVAIRDSSSPDGWRIETMDGDRRITAESSDFDDSLRSVLPLSVGAVLMGGLAVAFLRGHRRWATAAACVGLAAAVPALELYGKADTSTVAMGMAALAPATWLAWRPRLPLAASAIVSAAAAAFIAAWIAARLGAMPAYGQLEAIREPASYFGVLLVLALSVVVPILREGPGPFDRPRIGDTLLLAIAAGVALGLVAIVSVSIALALGLGAILLIPAWRRWFAAGAERTLLSDLREHARLEASEAERSRLARELHDVPLQELAGIIRRLELLPEAQAETDELRAVAAQLRGLATELRPPVLDDLGLAAALEFLAETASTDDVAVVTEVSDDTTLEPGGRPPAEVELAMFRVAQEAVTNALRHAGASEVRITGDVAPARVVLAVVDDGRGLDDEEARAAGRRGHLGLASIRHRAEAIEAEVEIGGSDHGTRVAIRWAR